MTATEPMSSPLVEQAKGVLMLRYGHGSHESLATLTQWSHEAGVTLQALCRAMVSGICQGRVGPEDRHVVRWLEQRLRGELPGPVAPPVPAPRSDGEVGRSGRRSAPDITMVKRWRYASAVHAARALETGV